eukprot:3356458-Pleurochrysis_carterae.AAC.1
MNYAIATIPEMIMLITKIMSPAYGIIEVVELHALWDFKGWLVPHMHDLRGFAKGQFGDGMHEFVLRKDGNGV